MTLDWRYTASDCRLAHELAPHVQGRWYFGTPPWSSSPLDTRRWWSLRDPVSPMAAGEFSTILMTMRDHLPGNDLWARNRYRLTRTHGAQQIREVMQAACIYGIIEGWDDPLPLRCICWARKGDCGFFPAS